MYRTKEQVEHGMKDELFRKAYGWAWERIDFANCEFQHNYGMEKPVSIHGWDWSITFGHWGALVTFADGWHGFTYPKLKSA